MRVRRLPHGRGTILDNVLQTNIELYSEEEKKQISDIRNQDRFVPYSERAKEIGVKSQIEMKTYIMGQGIHKSMTWKGIPVYKTTYDFTLYSMMIWDIKPKTIIKLTIRVILPLDCSFCTMTLSVHYRMRSLNDNRIRGG